MLPVCRYEVRREDRGGEDILSIVICTERDSRDVEEEYFGGDNAEDLSSDNYGGVVYQDEE